MSRKRRIPIENGDDNAPDEAAAEALADEPAAEVEDAEARIAALEAEVKEAREDHLRAVADLQNFRRRAQQEKRDAIRYGKDAVLETVLPVLDNFQRAVAAARETSDCDALLAGVELIQKQLHEVLTQHGVSPIEALGQPFDPHLHDAAGRIETDEHPEGTVVEELLKGYMAGDTVLRHSRVMVAAPPED